MWVKEEYSWAGFGNGLGSWESKCGLIIKQPHPEQTIVVVSCVAFSLHKLGSTTLSQYEKSCKSR